MGTLYRRTVRFCRTCGSKRLGKTAEQKACAAAGHTIEERQSPVWWVKYTRGGKAYAESSGSKKKGEAQRLLISREGDIGRGMAITPKVGRLKFAEAKEDLFTDYSTNKKRSEAVVRRRVEKHLEPFFMDWRMANITTADVRAYVVQRQTTASVLVKKGRTVALPDGTEQVVPDERRPPSTAEINRELALLKRMFNLAIQAGKLMHKPHIALLRENNVRTGFFEPEQYQSVLRHLPDEIRPIITFAYITGWRIASEVLPLEWRQVDFAGREIRLDAGTTKNGDGRVFPFIADLETLLKERWAEHERLKKEGHITRHVFVRLVAEGRGGEKKPRAITSFGKAWKSACRAAGCPGRIPHDLRRTAIRNMVRSGIPERVAMKLTGHKTPSVFARYDIVSGGDLREAAARLDGTPEQRSERTS